MDNYQIKHDLLYAEAREQVLMDFYTGNIPNDFKIKGYSPFELLDRAQYTRIFASGNSQSFITVVPDWLTQDIVDSLRLDGLEDFNQTEFDDHFTYETCRIWFVGMKRHYREIGHGSAITVNLLPAGSVIADCE